MRIPRMLLYNGLVLVVPSDRMRLSEVDSAWPLLRKLGTFARAYSLEYGVRTRVSYPLPPSIMVLGALGVWPTGCGRRDGPHQTGCVFDPFGSGGLYSGMLIGWSMNSVMFTLVSIASESCVAVPDRVEGARVERVPLVQVRDVPRVA